MSASCQQQELARRISSMHGCAFLEYKYCSAKFAGCLFYPWPVALKAGFVTKCKAKQLPIPPLDPGSSEACGEEDDEVPVG